MDAYGLWSFFSIPSRSNPNTSISTRHGCCRFFFSILVTNGFIVLQNSIRVEMLEPCLFSKNLQAMKNPFQRIWTESFVMEGNEKKNDSQNSNQSHKNMAVSQPVDGAKTTARELDLEQRAFLRNNHGRSITNDWFETFYYFSKLIRTGLVSLGWMSPTFLSNPSNHIVKYRSWLHCMSTMRVRWDVGSLFFVQERKKTLRAAPISSFCFILSFSNVHHQRRTGENQADTGWWGHQRWQY